MSANPNSPNAREDPLHNLPPWDPDEYDREVRASRSRALAPRPTSGSNVSRWSEPRRWSAPKQKPNGKWQVSFQHKGVIYNATFDTEREATEFIQQVKES